MLFGWQDLWDSVPGIFLAVPYGALADKYGRRWILTLGLAGAECTMLWIIFVCMCPALKFRVPRPVSNGKRRLLPAATQADLVLFGIYSYWWRSCSSGRNYFHDGVRCRSHGKSVECAFPLFRFSTDSGVEQLLFLYVTASVLVAELTAPALSSIFMKNGL